MDFLNRAFVKRMSHLTDKTVIGECPVHGVFTSSGRKVMIYVPDDEERSVAWNPEFLQGGVFFLLQCNMCDQLLTKSSKALIYSTRVIKWGPPPKETPEEPASSTVTEASPEQEEVQGESPVEEK